MTNFALIGAAGFIAPRHVKAIKEVGGHLLAATDPHTSVGVLDQCSLDTRFFSEIECFDKYLEELRRGPQEKRVNWVSICSPNYLHDAHIRMSLHNGANVICEKPLVINPNSLDMLQTIEKETGNKIYTVLQLRLHPKLVALKQKILEQPNKTDFDVALTYITARGSWYDSTWKGQTEKSGGINVNIGIHLFDLMLWLFGNVIKYEVHLQEPRKSSGVLYLKHARVSWFLSLDANDLKSIQDPELSYAHREILIDGKSFKFSNSFTDLHTIIYSKTLEGQGFGLDEARSSIELVDKIKKAKISVKEDKHPILRSM